MDSITSIPRWCLKTIGIKFRSVEEIESTSQKISSFFALFYMCCAFVGILNSCFVNRHDMVVFLESLGFVCTNLQTISKGVTIFMKRKELFRLNEKMVDLFSKEKECQGQLITLNRNIHRLLAIFFSLITISGVVFAMVPAVRLVYLVHIRHVNETVIRIFPYSNEPLFNKEFDVVYILNYIFMMGHGFIFVQVVTTVDGLFILFTINIRDHFKILQNQFRNNHFYGYRKLRNIIQKHVDLINTTEVLNDTYQLTMFAQALLTSLHMCILTFRISIAKDIGTILGYVPFLTTVLIELFFYCYGGEAIANESFLVQTAIQESSWYNLIVRDRKTLHMILLRAQKPLKMEAKFFELNMKLFLTILRTSASYITIMKSLNK